MVLYNDRKCIDGEQQVELLKRQYLQLVDPDQLSLPSFPALRLPDVQAQIYKSMFVNSTHTYTPPERYQYRVLKRLINQLEQAIQDPDEDVRFSFCWLQVVFFSSYSFSPTLHALRLHILADFAGHCCRRSRMI